MKTFDVVIVGAGTAGETLAGKGTSVALVEARRVGGECPFVACMPSKALLRSAHVRRLFPVLPDLGAAARPYQPDDDQAAYELAVRRRDRIVEDRHDAEHTRGVERWAARPRWRGLAWRSSAFSRVRTGWPSTRRVAWRGSCTSGPPAT